jgi:hypothetical protein
MNDETLSRENWARLFEAMVAIKALAPWEWMEDSDLFGVRDPETGEVYYVSVMGNLGGHLAVAAYPGAEGLAGFWSMQQEMLGLNPEALLLIPQLQASFEDRNVLTDRDRRVIKEMGLKFRGRQSWPQFRSWRPAHVPWYLEDREARVLAIVLEQVLDVAPRFGDSPDLLLPPSDTYLVRTVREVDGVRLWEDRRETAATPPDDIVIEIDAGLIDHLRRLPLSKAVVEIGVTMLPAPVQDGGERPYFPFNVLLVDAKSGYILATEMLVPQPSMIAMWGRLAETVARKLAAYPNLPGKLKVGNALLQGLLQPLSAELGLPVEQTRRLPALQEAQASMLAMWR